MFYIQTRGILYFWYLNYIFVHDAFIFLLTTGNVELLQLNISAL